MAEADNNMGGVDGGGGATPDQNPSCAGGGGGDQSNSKVYKGVRKRKWGKWVSEIRLPNSRERIWLGSYDSAEKAARAFDAALYCLRGCRANFNFPDTPLNLDISNAHHSLSSQEIQVIAAKFANNNNPQDRIHGGGTDNSCSIGSSFESKAKSDSATESSYTVQGDNIGEVDWSKFLNELGDSDEYGLFCELDKMHSGELLMCSTTLFQDNNVDDVEGADPFSNQPFLWNW